MSDNTVGVSSPPDDSRSYPAPRFRVVLGESRVLQSFTFTPRWEESDRILRMKPESAVSRSAQDVYDRILSNMDALVQPAAVYGLFLPNQIEIDVFGNPDCLGLCVVTMGHRVDLEIETRTDSGRISEAALIDAFASAYAEGAAIALNRTLIDEGSRLAMRSGPRKSPGFGRWPIESQSELIHRTGAERILVRLSNGFMMTPQKSISFAVPFWRLQPSI